jgi:hypothetical protein
METQRESVPERRRQRTLRESVWARSQKGKTGLLAYALGKLESWMILKSNESIRLIVVEASASTSSEQGQVGGGRGKMMVVEGKEERWRRCHRVELIYPLHGNDIILLHFTRKMLLTRPAPPQPILTT